MVDRLADYIKAHHGQGVENIGKALGTPTKDLTVFEKVAPDPALRCPTCSGRMRVMTTLAEPGTVKKILAHLGLPTYPLPRARARDSAG